MFVVCEVVAVVADICSHRLDELLGDGTVGALMVELVVAAVGEVWTGHASDTNGVVKYVCGTDTSDT